MPFFMKKPVIIEARQLTEDNAKDLLEWTQSYDSLFNYISDGKLVIGTRGGDHEASVGDWIIRVENKFCVCKPEVFEMTYEQRPLPEIERAPYEDLHAVLMRLGLTEDE